jgi:zinc/manganese transport system substrate-binding protein
MLRRLFLLALLLSAAPAAAESRLRAVATFSVVGDFVTEIGGDRVDVAVLVGPDADVHGYQPRPADARVLAAARLLVSNGRGLEGWIGRLAQAAAFKGELVVASEGCPGGPDPHCWQDVAGARRYVANIVAGLAKVDPANEAYYRERGRRYDARLGELDAWVRRQIADVPADRRKAITGHNSFAYFGRAYGIEFSTPRGYSTESEPTARDVAALIREVRERKVKALFVENMTNPGLIDQIAHDSGATVGARLYSDALSPPEGPAASYEAMMRHNVGALVSAMNRN